VKRASALLALLCGCASVPDRRDSRYMGVVLRDERPLVVAGKASRIENLPSGPQIEEHCNAEGKDCDITIRSVGPQLVYFKVSEVLDGEATPGEELAFLYLSHMGFSRKGDEVVIVLDPVAGDRWDWRVRNGSGEPVFHTFDGRKAIAVTPAGWTRLPCSIARQAGPLEFVEKERWDLPVPQHGILLGDLREALRRASLTESDLDSGCPANDRSALAGAYRSEQLLDATCLTFVQVLIIIPESNTQTSPIVFRHALPRRQAQRVTLRIENDVPSLRSARRFGAIRGCHLHPIVGADDSRTLSRGAQGFCIRVARAVNKVLGRSGRVFADHYHSHLLGSPTELVRAIKYVLGNAGHHYAEVGADACSWGVAGALELLMPTGWLVRADGSGQGHAIAWRRASFAYKRSEVRSDSTRAGSSRCRVARLASAIRSEVEIGTVSAIICSSVSFDGST
jgi:hypothetical protein